MGRDRGMGRGRDGDWQGEGHEDVSLVPVV